jgi:hypothetical protein
MMTDATTIKAAPTMRQLRIEVIGLVVLVVGLGWSGAL